ncbi:MAG: FAD-dependent oxidoreductase [Deltaproteobacteria bacterium]|nr:FAD-dependent oxidoreductase [Deltaproteobacteria bacterium]
MSKNEFDVIIFGSGPAGLQAAIHAARRKVSVLVLGRLPKSSAYRAHIENFLCVEGATGADLLKQARIKAEESGAEFLEEDVTELGKKDGHFVVKVETNRTLTAKALIFATGISRNKLGLRGEKAFLGRGVSYCVDCDGGFYRGEPVAVIGNGSAAVTGALTLLFYASEVHLVCENLDVADYLVQKLKESAIEIHEGKKVVEIMGDESVKGLLLDDGTSIDVSGVFIELGAKGAMDLAGYLGVAPDNETMKYIAVNEKQETNVSGVYAAGDICGPPWQVAKAVGQGCIAGLEAAAYAKKM